MAHELSNVDGVVEMFYYGEKPWHGLGTQVDSYLTANEALEAASLNWDVYKTPVSFKHNDEDVVVPDKYATVRITNDGTAIPLGIVGKKYEVIQNVDAFSFLDQIIGSDEAVFETAGALKNGAVVWALAKLKEDMVVGDVDVVNQYLLFSKSHDGSKAVRMFWTPVRVVCNNTLSSALSGQKSTGVKIRHSGDIMVKVDKAIRLLGLAKDTYVDINNTYNAMYKTQISDTVVKQYIEKVFPAGKENKVSTRTENIRQNVWYGYNTGRGAKEVRGTLWGAYNAVTEYTDHTKYEGMKTARDKRNANETRMEAVVWGSGAGIKARAYGYALDYVS